MNEENNVTEEITQEAKKKVEAGARPDGDPSATLGTPPGREHSSLPALATDVHTDTSASRVAPSEREAEVAFWRFSSWVWKM